MDSWSSSPETRYIEVPRKNITAQTLEKGGIVSTEKPTPGTFEDFMQRTLLVDEALIEVNGIKPDRLLERSFSVARSHINVLRANLGMTPLGESQMRLILLNKDDFLRASRRLSSSGDSDSISFTSDDIKSVVVMNQPDIPAYIVGSDAFHELIHKWFETHTRVFYYDNTEQRVHTESRRSGLEVSRIGRDKSEIRTAGTAGSLVNELPNFMLQKVYINEVLGNLGLNTDFKTEIDERNRKLDEYMGNSQYLIITTEEGAKIVLDRSNVHFGKDGVPLFERQGQVFLTMQLAEDLARACDSIKPELFWGNFLKAKSDLRLQNQIRIVVDKHMGTGFYSRLKRAEYNIGDTIKLLVETQAKLYTFNET
ncbi:hypothetical protein FJZ40_03475 [Candidatus Shapirobacteria bacterium]|nr:hypothetical protein [Candidatus Shapirobacteria bacterium]